MIDLSLCNCAECPLKNTKKVLGEGISKGEISNLEQYDIVALGISPAKEELKQGRPMVGWSGSLLRKVLAKIHVEHYYLTNTFLCYYPDDLPDTETKHIVKAAIKCCSARLEAELSSVKPKLIIALGNIPLEAATGTEYQITKVSGRIINGIVAPVLAITHPASLKRRPEDFVDFVDTLQTAPSYIGGTLNQVTEPESVIVNEENYTDVLQTIENASRDTEVTVDLETTGGGFYPYGREPDKIRCAILAVDNHTAYIVPAESSPYFDQHPNFFCNDDWRKILGNAKCNFHNGPFDIGFLKQAGFDKVKINFDTFLAHYMLDEREYSHGLKPLSRKFLGAPDWEEGLAEFLPNKNSSYDLIPDKNLYEYAAYDAVCTRMLTDIFKPRVDAYPVFYNLIMPAVNMFADLRHRGIKVDLDVLANLDEILEVTVEEAEENLNQLAGCDVNASSPLEVAELMYRRMKLIPSRMYGESTSAKAIAQYPGNPVLDAINEVRQLKKQRGTYVWGLAKFLDNNMKIHPFVKFHGTVTGRLSSVDPSVFNVAANRGKGIKKLYLPSESNHLIGEFDQKQMELRCYCIVGKDTYLKNMLLSGADPHAIVTEKIYGKEFISDKRKRLKTKAGVFGRLYLRQKSSFMASYQMSGEEVDKLLKVIDSLFPGIGEYVTTTKAEIREKGFLESYFGRRRRFGLIMDENLQECYRQGVNFRIQSMGSDINLFTMLHLYEMREQLHAIPLFPVHDSILMDMESKECVPIIKAEIERYAKELVGNVMEFKVDSEVGKSWGDTSPWEGN